MERDPFTRKIDSTDEMAYVRSRSLRSQINVIEAAQMMCTYLETSDLQVNIGGLYMFQTVILRHR